MASSARENALPAGASPNKAPDRPADFKFFTKLNRRANEDLPMTNLEEAGAGLMTGRMWKDSTGKSSTSSHV